MAGPSNSGYDPGCRRCERLAIFLDDAREKYPGYHCAPVAPFGDPDGRLLIVGLAPGMHGANATGRPFTGDFAGILLYETLHRFGFATAPRSEHRDDGLELIDCRLTNAVKCVPPQNKPNGAEINTCNQYLASELRDSRCQVLLALGSIAHNAILKACGLKLSGYKFAHNALHELPGNRRLLDSYHCSRYNTQTRRLTAEMFADVFVRVRELLPA